MNELLMRMLEPLDVHSTLFSQYAATLARLAQSQPMSVELRHFEHRLLTECGYVPDFLRSTTQEPIEPQACYELVPEVGFSLLAATQTAKVQGYTGATLLAIAKGDYRVRQTRSAALEIFRIALRTHLGNKPLVSREMLIRRDAS
jgi:DNA repair protein RecO (recombination protein O)